MKDFAITQRLLRWDILQARLRGVYRLGTLSHMAERIGATDDAMKKASRRALKKCRENIKISRR